MSSHNELSVAYKPVCVFSGGRLHVLFVISDAPVSLWHALCEVNFNSAPSVSTTVDYCSRHSMNCFSRSGVDQDDSIDRESLTMQEAEKVINKVLEARSHIGSREFIVLDNMGRGRHSPNTSFNKIETAILVRRYFIKSPSSMSANLSKALKLNRGVPSS